MTLKRSVIILAAAALTALTVPVSAKDTVVDSIWAAVPLTIDGATQDWDDATPFFDKASGAQYAFKNDGQNLYVVMILRGAVARSTIDFTGMKVYLTTGPKKAKDSGLLFIQKQLTPDELIASLEKKGEPVAEARKAEIRKQKGYTVFVEEPLAPPAAGASGAEPRPEPAHFRALQSAQAAVYEFKIPLSRIGAPGTAVQPGSAFKVGFEWGGMTKQIMKNIMAQRAESGSVARQSQGSSDSGFRDSSGEGGYEGPDFASFSRDKRYSKHAFWTDVKLAQAK